MSGETSSANFPVTTGVYDFFYNGLFDVFVSKLNGNLTSLLASTYLGGSSNDNAYSMASDANGNIYVAGSTFSGNYPTTSNAYDTSYNGFSDAFVSKFNGNLTTLLASTFLGSLANDSARSIALDLCGNAYVIGYTGSSGFPTTSDAHDTSYNGGFTDAFVTTLKGDLTSPLLYSTFFGGTGNDAFNTGTCFDKCFFADIVIDSRRNVYVAGETDSTDFPTTSGAFNEASNGGSDVFVSKFSISLPVSQYTLTVTKGGTGSGTVTSNPAGIDCGSVCSDTFKACTQVTLTATADIDSTFTGWTGCTTVSGYSCTVTMNKDNTVTATFTLKPLTPVTGDWNGDGKTKIGVYYNGTWYIDLNGNVKWDGTGPGNDATYNLRSGDGGEILEVDSNSSIQLGSFCLDSPFIGN